MFLVSGSTFVQNRPVLQSLKWIFFENLNPDLNPAQASAIPCRVESLGFTFTFTLTLTLTLALALALTFTRTDAHAHAHARGRANAQSTTQSIIQ